MIPPKSSNSAASTPVSRRTFLGLAAAGVTVASAARGASAARRVDDPTAELLARARADRKIDAHAHLGFGPTRRLPVAQLLRAADALGIARLAVSVPSGPEPAQFIAGNDVVLAAMRAHPDRIIGQCCVNPRFGREALEEVRRCLGEGMCGLGELYTYARANDPVFFSIVEACIAQNASLLWHARADLGFVRPGHRTGEPRTTTTAADLVELARRYPEAILIHGHIGGGGDWEHLCLTLQATPSVYLDTSGSVSEPGMIDFAVRTLGVERLLFASDVNFEVGVGKILSAHLDAAQRAAIFHDNFAALLRRRGIHAN